MEYIHRAKIFRCASMRNMEFIFKFHSLFSVVRQLMIPSAMLHSVINNYVQCKLYVNGSTSLVNICT